MSSLTPLGRVLNATGTIRRFKDGNGEAFVWRWWHPLSWLLAPLLFILVGLLEGFPEAWRYKHDSGFGLSPYWRQRRDEIEWL